MTQPSHSPAIAPVLETTRTQAELIQAVQKWVQQKEMIKESQELLKELFETIELCAEELGGEDLFIDMPDGTCRKVGQKTQQRETLDKEALIALINAEANERDAYLTKSDLKTPWDYSMLTKQNRIQPKMIAACTVKITKTKTTVTSVKKKPKTRQAESN